MRKIRNILLSILVLTGFILSPAISQIVPPTIEPTPSSKRAQELIVDSACISEQIINVSPTGVPGPADFSRCSRICPRWCLYEAGEDDSYTLRKNGFCTVDSMDSHKYICRVLEEEDLVIDYLEKVNFMGITVDRAPLILIRRAMLGVLGAAGLAIIGIGIYAAYKYATSEGQQEKIQEAIKIFKSLIIGAVIVFAGAVLVQVVAMLVGITGSLTDFNFLPRSGRVVYLYKDDLGKACLLEQMPAAEGEQYDCNEETLVWTEIPP